MDELHSQTLKSSLGTKMPKKSIFRYVSALNKNLEYLCGAEFTNYYRCSSISLSYNFRLSSLSFCRNPKSKYLQGIRGFLTTSNINSNKYFLGMKFYVNVIYLRVYGLQQLKAWYSFNVIKLITEGYHVYDIFALL